jgi:hypothetical protein
MFCLDTIMNAPYPLARRLSALSGALLKDYYKDSLEI